MLNEPWKGPFCIFTRIVLRYSVGAQEHTLNPFFELRRRKDQRQGAYTIYNERAAERSDTAFAVHGGVFAFNGLLCFCLIGFVFGLQNAGRQFDFTFFLSYSRSCVPV